MGHHVRLKQLELAGFRSFVEPATIDFPESGLILIRGYNRDTGSGSGSGKSSLVLALAHALGFCPYPATELQSWHTEEPLSIKITFLDQQGNEVILNRPGKSLVLGGKKITGAAKVEEAWGQFIRLSPEMLAALTYRGQDEPGLFLSKTDGEKKEFLTALLGLERYEQQVERSQKLVSESLAPAVLASEARRNQAAANLARLEGNLTPPAPADLDGYLTQIAGLNVQLKELEDQHRASLAILETQEKAARTQRDLLVAGQAPSLEILDRKVQELKAALTQPVEVDETELKRIRVMVQSATDALQLMREHDDGLRAEVEQRRKLELEAISKLKVTVGRRGFWEKAQKEAQQRLGKLEAQTCPTCERPWTEHQATVEKTREELAQGVLGLAACDEAQKRIQASELLLARLGFTPNPKVAQWEKALANAHLRLEEVSRDWDRRRMEVIQQRNQALLEAVQKRGAFEEGVRQQTRPLDEKLQSYKAQRAEAEQDFSVEGYRLREQVQGLSYKVKLAEQEAATAQKRYQQDLADIEQARAHLVELERGHAQAVAALAAEKDFQALCGREGFLGTIFDEVLEEISRETNRILAAIPNTAHVSLSFRSEVLTQKGKVNKTIVPVTHISGREAKLSSGCSGGMKTAINLAVDLAVGAVIGRRTGVTPGWLVLDECFNGLPMREKEACLEMLQPFARDRLILVVEHGSEFKELFSQFLNVEYRQGCSTVVTSYE